MAFENFQGSFALGFVVDHGLGVVIGQRLSFWRSLSEALRIDVGELGDPTLDVFSVVVVAFALGPWILDAEIRRGIGAGSG